MYSADTYCHGKIFRIDASIEPSASWFVCIQTWMYAVHGATRGGEVFGILFLHILTGIHADRSAH